MSNRRERIFFLALIVSVLVGLALFGTALCTQLLASRGDYSREDLSGWLFAISGLVIFLFPFLFAFTDGFIDGYTSSPFSGSVSAKGKASGKVASIETS